MTRHDDTRPTYEGRVLPRPDEEVVDQGLAFDLTTLFDRRRALQVLGIGVAGGALLRAMGLHREDVGAVQQLFIGLGIVGTDPLDELILADHRGSPGMRQGRRAAR